MRWQLALLVVAGCGDNLSEQVLFVRPRATNARYALSLFDWLARRI